MPMQHAPVIQSSKRQLFFLIALCLFVRVAAAAPVPTSHPRGVPQFSPALATPVPPLPPFAFPSTLKEVFLHQVEPPSFPYRLHPSTEGVTPAPSSNEAPVTSAAERCSTTTEISRAFQVALLQDVKHKTFRSSNALNLKLAQLSNDLGTAVQRVVSEQFAASLLSVGFFSDKLPVRRSAVCFGTYRISSTTTVGTVAERFDDTLSSVAEDDWLGGQWEAVGRCAKAQFGLDDLCAREKEGENMPLRVIIIITDSLPHSHGDLAKIVCSTSQGTETSLQSGQITDIYRNCSEVSHIDAFDTLESREIRQNPNSRCEVTEYPKLIDLAALLRQLRIWLIVLVETAVEPGSKEASVPEQRKFAAALSKDGEGGGDMSAFLDPDWGVARMYQAMLNEAEVRSVIARVVTSDPGDLRETLALALKTIAVKNCILEATETHGEGDLKSVCEAMSATLPPPPVGPEATNVRTEPAVSTLASPTRELTAASSSALPRSSCVSSEPSDSPSSNTSHTDRLVGGALPPDGAESDSGRLGVTLAICSASLVGASLAIIGGVMLVRRSRGTISTFPESSSSSDSVSLSADSNAVTGVSATQRDVIESISPSAYA